MNDFVIALWSFLLVFIAVVLMVCSYHLAEISAALQ